MVLRLVHRAISRMRKISDSQVRTFRSKEERKALQKSSAKAREQERKRALTDFAHYENSDISDYYFCDGFRKVFPYYFVFKAYAKRRWLARSLRDVLLDEFTFPSADLITERCRLGDIRVNDTLVSEDYILKDTDLISHKVHRHELPVLDTPPIFVHEDDDVLVVVKPASVPVHPCGQYTLNSMVHILAKDYGFRPLRFIHRLDRMTSGLLIIAKNYDASLRLTTQINERQVKKFYLCQVDGFFLCQGSDSSDDLPAGVVVCSQPLGPLSCKLGVYAVLPENAGGKSAVTHFIRLTYDKATDRSLVLCRLFTGRTHQIRVHAQFLGHPLVNDPLYNSTVWGDQKGKGAQYDVPADEVVRRISNHRSISAYIENEEVRTYFEK
ncbi:unnamed protein product [Dicrocoelium dendriticum]|nr:unnamed protein product [Dicrocoelium dendriticum]